MFERGDIVFHASLGPGEVLEVRTADALVVFFPAVGRALVSRRALELLRRPTWNGSGGASNVARRDAAWTVALRDPPRPGARWPHAGARGWFRSARERFRGIVEGVEGPYVVVLAEDGRRRYLPKRSLRAEIDAATAAAIASAQIPAQVPARRAQPQAPSSEARQQRQKRSRASRPQDFVELVRRELLAHPRLQSRVGGTPTTAWILHQIAALRPHARSERELAQRIIAQRIAIADRMEAYLAAPPRRLPPPTPEEGPVLTATQQIQRMQSARAAQARMHAEEGRRQAAAARAQSQSAEARMHAEEGHRQAAAARAQSPFVDEEEGEREEMRPEPDRRRRRQRARMPGPRTRKMLPMVAVRPLTAAEMLGGERRERRTRPARTSPPSASRPTAPATSTRQGPDYSNPEDVARYTRALSPAHRASFERAYKKHLPTVGSERAFHRAVETMRVAAGEESDLADREAGEARAQMAARARLPADQRRWVHGVRPDTSGTRQFILMIRHPDDPERQGRGSETGDIAPHRTLARLAPDEVMRAIHERLADGRPRTFNRLSVELFDKTADITGGTVVEEALWQLVERGDVEFTHDAPVLFRARRPRAKASASAARDRRRSSSPSARWYA